MDGWASPALFLEGQGDPANRLAQVDEEIARVEASPAPDPRLVFDLIRLRVDLLLELGAEAEAAQSLVALARYAGRHRSVLDIDLVPIHLEAVTLLEAAGAFVAAARELAAVLAEQRSGALPADILAATLGELARLTALSGDAAEAAALRRAAEAVESDRAVARGGTGGYRAVTVFYATDRARSGSPMPSRFYDEGRGELELGTALVTIPESHEPGLIETPSVWRLEFGPDPARHVVLRSVEPLPPNGFFARLDDELSAQPDREAFVFVHGYNSSFEQAAKRAAQIAYDMDYAGVPILYSWPSQGSSLGYVADTAVVRLSGRRLSRFLEDLVERSGTTTIHLVAHSMGNRALTDALELMALRRGTGPADPPVFGQVLFAAPDIDAGLFREMLPTIRPIARRLTLYASEKDWALAASRKLHGDAPRAGQGGAGMLVDALIDSVDMSDLGEDMLAHSYFADDRSALADMLTLFWRNADPEQRCGLVEAALGSWRYVRGRCAPNDLIDLLAYFRSRNVVTEVEAQSLLRTVIADKAAAAQLEEVVARIFD